MHLEDINVGDYLTPLDGGQPRDLIEERERESAIWSPFTTMTYAQADQRGIIYCVIALDLPFAIVQCMPNKRHMIDLRDHTWKRLSPEFVAAVIKS